MNPSHTYHYEEEHEESSKKDDSRRNEVEFEKEEELEEEEDKEETTGENNKAEITDRDLLELEEAWNTWENSDKLATQYAYLIRKFEKR